MVDLSEALGARNNIARGSGRPPRSGGSGGGGRTSGVVPPPVEDEMAILGANLINIDSSFAKDKEGMYSAAVTFGASDRARVPVPGPGTVSKFRAVAHGNGFDGPITVTVLKNGVAVGASITIPAGDSAVKEIVMSEAFADKDLISFRAVTTASVGSIAGVSASVKFDSTT